MKRVTIREGFLKHSTLLWCTFQKWTSKR